METISVAHLREKLAAEPEAVVLDVRSPGEFRGIHIPGAVNVPLDTVDPAKLADHRGKSLVLVCQSGIRARTAASRLSDAGFQPLFVLEGGTQAWAAAGNPVERSGGGAISIERQVRIGAGSLVLAGVVLGVFVNPLFLGLSAFVGAGLVFAGVTDWCGMGLLLARAPWNR